MQPCAGAPSLLRTQQRRHVFCHAQGGGSGSPAQGPNDKAAAGGGSGSGGSTAATASAEDLSLPSGPWTPEELQELGQRFYDTETENTGASWLSEFEDDPELLYDYVDRAYEQGFSEVISPITLLAVSCMHAWMHGTHAWAHACAHARKCHHAGAGTSSRARMLLSQVLRACLPAALTARSHARLTACARSCHCVRVRAA